MAARLHAGGAQHRVVGSGRLCADARALVPAGDQAKTGVDIGHRQPDHGDPDGLGGVSDADGENLLSNTLRDSARPAPDRLDHVRRDSPLPGHAGDRTVRGDQEFSGQVDQ